MYIYNSKFLRFSHRFHTMATFQDLMEEIQRLKEKNKKLEEEKEELEAQNRSWIRQISGERIAHQGEQEKTEQALEDLRLSIMSHEEREVYRQRQQAQIDEFREELSQLGAKLGF